MRFCGQTVEKFGAKFRPCFPVAKNEEKSNFDFRRTLRFRIERAASFFVVGV
jgi:hypothetical protein